MDAASEAKRIAFDRTGQGDTVLFLSGFPQTRHSWNKVVPLLSRDFTMVTADLPSFGDSGILSAPATTENAGRIFHETALPALGTASTQFEPPTQSRSSSFVKDRGLSPGSGSQLLAPLVVELRRCIAGDRLAVAEPGSIE